MFCITATAGTLTNTKTWGQTSANRSFNSEWEDEKVLKLKSYDSSEVGKMKYGFDTDWVDEDYCMCYFVDHNCRASIYRAGKKTVEGSYGSPAVWSICEVKHTSSTISYYATAYKDY